MREYFCFTSESKKSEGERCNIQHIVQSVLYKAQIEMFLFNRDTKVKKKPTDGETVQVRKTVASDVFFLFRIHTAKYFVSTIV